MLGERKNRTKYVEGSHNLEKDLELRVKLHFFLRCEMA